jgi:hypothetical protein
VLVDARRHIEALARQRQLLDELTNTGTTDPSVIAEEVARREEIEGRVSIREAMALEELGDYVAAEARREE